MASNKKLIILAVGGNSLILDETKKSVRDQFEAVQATSKHIAALVRNGYRVLVTHGNGPQVGFILRRSELSRHELHEVPLDSCGADTQGAIGYQLQQALRNELRDMPTPPTVATVVTQVLVDKNDPSFKKPSKPIGSFMSEADAMAHKEKEGWDVVEDAGRGWRRVVASPRPKKVIEIDAIRTLLDNDCVVVAVGGGGIPVIEKDNGELVGTAAVIDKDFATSLLATELNADMLIISTAIDQVYVNFKKPDQKTVPRMTVAEAKQYVAEGQFAPGSMLPKVIAMIEFIEKGGKEALITDPPHLVDALAGKAGTWIVP